MDSNIAIEALTVPLRQDAQGVLKVGSTRVTLDTVVAAFHRGATAEEIVIGYPVLSLPDVYAVITYYLMHRDELDRYFEERQKQAETTRREVEARSDPHGIRERLLARRPAGE